MYKNETKEPLTPEEKTALAKKRTFGVIVLIDVVLVILILWEIIELFV
jgi:biopolymer transport protein ExbD